MADNRKPITIGVAGGSGAGKSTIARVILERLGQERLAYIAHDSYYRDLSDLPREQRAQFNFDHPNSLESELLREHILQLQAGKDINVPIYDFATHTRTSEYRHVPSQRLILVEGILIFAESTLRDLFDMRIYIETDPDIRFIRRLQRDLTERDRSVESVINQWLQTVRPMHLEFVEASKRYAHIIIPEGGLNEVATDMVVARLERLLED